MSVPVVVSFPDYSRGGNASRETIHAAVAAEMARVQVTFTEHHRLAVGVQLVMTPEHFRFNDVDNRLKDVMDALQARVGGPKAIRRLRPLIPNDKPVVRDLIEKVEGAVPGARLTIRVLE